MRLWNRNESVVGGWVYYIDDASPIRGETFNNLITNVKSVLFARREPIPENIQALIEDQICMAQPNGKCRPSKGLALGDRVSVVIHAGARVIDKIAGTELEKKAKVCKSCGQRRVAMNG